MKLCPECMEVHLSISVTCRSVVEPERLTGGHSAELFSQYNARPNCFCTQEPHCRTLPTGLWPVRLQRKAEFRHGDFGKLCALQNRPPPFKQQQPLEVLANPDQMCFCLSNHGASPAY